MPHLSPLLAGPNWRTCSHYRQPLWSGLPLAVFKEPDASRSRNQHLRMLRWLCAATRFHQRWPISCSKALCSQVRQQGDHSDGVAFGRPEGLQPRPWFCFSVCDSSCSYTVVRKSCCWSKRPGHSPSPGTADTPAHVGEEAFELLGSAATENLAAVAQERILRQALARIGAMRGDDGPLATYAAQRAKYLLADHERVRSATASMPGAPRVTVEPVLPPDVLGLYVLIPGGV